MIKIIQFIEQHGVDLSPEGVNNHGLNKTDALNLLNNTELNCIVLGGDVYHYQDRHPEINYDNWYFEPSGDRQADIDASIAKAKTYINQYQLTAVLFAFTFD